MSRKINLTMVVLALVAFAMSEAGSPLFAKGGGHSGGGHSGGGRSGGHSSGHASRGGHAKTANKSTKSPTKKSGKKARAPRRAPVPEDGHRLTKKTGTGSRKTGTGTKKTGTGSRDRKGFRRTTSNPRTGRDRGVGVAMETAAGAVERMAATVPTAPAWMAASTTRRTRPTSLPW